MIAARNGNFEVFNGLSVAGASATAVTKAQQTLLMSAVMGGNEFIVRAVLNSESNINAKTSDGFTALIFAASGKNEEIFSCLLAAGAQMDVVTSTGSTALTISNEAGNGKTRLVDITTKKSTLVASVDKIHPLPFPGLNIDNLPFFAIIAATAKGRTLIHDWVYENRAIYLTELSKLNAKVELLDPHLS